MTVRPATPADATPGPWAELGDILETDTRSTAAIVIDRPGGRYTIRCLAVKPIFVTPLRAAKAILGADLFIWLVRARVSLQWWWDKRK